MNYKIEAVKRAAVAAAAIATIIAPAGAQTTGTSVAEPKVPGEITTTTTVPEFRQSAVTSNPAAASRRTVVFFGERPKWAVTGKQPAIRDVVSTASQILNASVVDATVADEPVSETAKRIAAVVSSQPTAVILFTGRTDEKVKTSDENLQKALKATVDGIREKNIQVFIVPSATSVGAGLSGRMRVVASTNSANYIEPGTEYAGRPYEEALEEIKGQLQQANAGAPATASTGTAPPSNPGSGVAIPTPPNLAPSGEQGSFTAGPASTPVTIHMPPAAPIKSFDPREAVKKKPTPARKQPAVAR